MATTSSPTHLPTIDPHLRQESGRELQATLVDLVDLMLVGKQLHWSVGAKYAKPGLAIAACTRNDRVGPHI